MERITKFQCCGTLIQYQVNTHIGMCVYIKPLKSQLVNMEISKDVHDLILKLRIRERIKENNIKSGRRIEISNPEKHYCSGMYQ